MLENNRKLKLSIIGGIGVCVLFGAYIYLFRPLSPSGTEAGVAAIQNYETTHEGCDGLITVVASRKMLGGRAEGSWYESWKIQNACDETHLFLIRFGVSPDARAFVIEFEIVE